MMQKLTWTSSSTTRLTAACASAVTLAACGGRTTNDEPAQRTSAAMKTPPTLQETSDDLGQLESSSESVFDAGASNGFFASLGSNGRTCNSCHVVASGWTITPLDAQARARNDPLFAPVDGADCPPTSAAQLPDSTLSTEVTGYGLIRIQIGIPANADFKLVSATNPEGCAIAPGSAGAGGQLFMFRRPLPSTNLIFESAIMWDGRENLEKPATTVGEGNKGPFLFDLNDQANSATLTHAQGMSIAGTPAQADIVGFETSLYTAQSLQKFQHVALDGDGANGGAQYLADTVAPAFFIGRNDPLKPGFTNAAFDLFTAWEPTSPTYGSLKKSEQAIGRGEALFNGTTFTIHDIPGLNSVPLDPLYNPTDPLAGADIVGGCAVCHNSPDVGNHSTALAINIGVTLAQPVNNDGSKNTVLDVAKLPVYVLSNGSSQIAVTDPGKALISGHFLDAGKTKGPMLRGLSARAPYFHNGSAKDLATVVAFYNARFAIGLTADQQADLVAFLQAL
jgi:cytochrome c peroxidase